MLLMPPPAIQAPPESGLDEALRSARALAAAGRPAEAALRLDPWAAAGRREAVIANATYLAWAGHLGASRARLEGWLVDHGDDLEARLLRAQVLAWQGRWKEARAAYDSLASIPASADGAHAGLARLAIWEQDPLRAQAEFERLGPAVSTGEEGKLLGAQITAAEGHPAAARLATGALAAAQGPSGDAEPVSRSLDDRLGPWVEAGFSRTDTSEGLRILAPSLHARVPIGDGALDLGWSGDEVSLGAAEAKPGRTQLAFSHPAGSRWSFSASVQRVREVEGGATGFAFGASFLIAPGFQAGYRHSRDFTTVTPVAVAIGTALTTDALDFQARITGRQSLALALDRTRLSEGPLRAGYRADYRFLLPHGPLQAWWGLSARGFTYSEQLALGFYTPSRYRWRGGAAGADWTAARSLSLSLQGEAGAQSVAGGASTLAWDYRLQALWTPGSGHATLSAGWGQSYAGVPLVDGVSAGSYRERTFTFGLRLRDRHGRLAP